jgi:hypothetical protein
VDGAVAANYLARFYMLASQYSYLKAAWWRELHNGGIDPLADDDHFGFF